MTDERALLKRTAELAANYLDTLGTRAVYPPATVEQLRAALGGPLPETSSDPAAVIESLAAAAEPGIVAMGSGRYFGFVIGGAVPAALAADWLTSTWDQNAGLVAGGPAAAVVEEVAGAWLKDLLDLPADASFAFVTGCQMASATCLAAARNAVLAGRGWDVERSGLAGAPPIRVVVGAKRHATIDRALRLLGLGTGSLVAVAADVQGRMVPAALAAALRDLPGQPLIVCAQAGEVNSGAFDDFTAIAPLAKQAGAWLHVDGAFGLWAAAVPELRHLVAGATLADSWSTDAHKTLNVPYDSGLAFVRHRAAHRAAMTTRAEYLIQEEPGGVRDQMDWNPEFSRRARGFAIHSALRELGREGVRSLVGRLCGHARRAAAELARLRGCAILNEVVFNQVLLSFEDDAATHAALARVQSSGEAWLSGTQWGGRAAIRVSVSNWRTSDGDIDRLVAAFEAARR